MLAQDRHVKAKAAGALQSLAVDEDNQVRPVGVRLLFVWGGGGEEM